MPSSAATEDTVKTKAKPTATKRAAAKKVSGRAPAAAKKETGAVADHNARMAAGDAEAKKEAARAAKEAKADVEGMETLEKGSSAQSWLDKPVDDLSEVRRWIIGKSPQEGGEENEYAVYYQRPLGHMARMRFFSLMTSAFSRALRATGGQVAGMGDVFGNQGGTMVQRYQRLRERDWSDASSFMVMAFELASYYPDLFIEAYTIWLDVPTGERIWAKQVFEQDWDPANNRWGLTDEDHDIIVGTFIDQNYEKLRAFFTSTLPGQIRRVVQNEKARKEREDRASTSDQSKPSSTSGQPEEETP